MKITTALLFTILAMAVLPSPARAQGGPPLITDDPDTPGPGFWEINIGMLLEKTTSERRIETPRVDLNYGVGRRIQLKFEMPWVVNQRDGQAETAAGDGIVGVKWRFIGQEGERIAWSIYPQLEVNMGSSAVTKEIEHDGSQFLMPTELTVEAFHLEINGEVGWNFVSNGSDDWIFGASTEGHVLPRLELLAELRCEKVLGEDTTLMAVGGGRLKLTTTSILMFAIGHSVRSAPDEGRLYVYAGLQLNLPHQFDFKPKVQPRRP